jgi:uncharacterized membrane-anchored protein YjiN (DUF445 family)
MRLEIESPHVQSRWQYAVASSLLVIAAVIFLSTLAAANPGFWILLARASAEAALVGGFADWFAVTALFRRPLGAPIPHTAVVPRSKDRIGEGLAAFFEQNFLTREIMSATLQSIDPAHKLAEWLAIKKNADELTDQALRLLPHFMVAADDTEIRALFSKSIHNQLQQVDFGPLLGRTIEELAASGYHAALLDDALKACKNFLEKREGRFEELVAERHRGWIRKTLDRQIARAIIHGIEDFIDDLLEQGGGARQKLLFAIEERARAAILARSDPATLEELKLRLLENPDVRALLASLWDQLREATLENFASPSSRARPTLSNTINSIGHALSNDAIMRDRLNRLFEAVVAEILPWREELANLIADVVKKWDTHEFSNRIETAVGSDLQYIRINGTIVGATVGCLLYLGETALK